MARHDQYTNDPILATGHQLHTPDSFGTSDQRVAFPTASLVTGEQWTETDTGITYKWYGTYWGIFGNGAVGAAGSVVAGPLVLETTLVLGGRLVIL